MQWDGKLDLANHSGVTSEMPIKLRHSDIKYLVRQLKARPDITEIDLTDNMVDDKGAAALATLSQLRVLNLDHNDLTIRGVQSLAQHAGLKALDISNNMVVNSKALEVFADHPSITNLSLNGIGRYREHYELWGGELPGEGAFEPDSVELWAAIAKKTKTKSYHENPSYA